MQSAALRRDGAEIEERRGLLCCGFQRMFGVLEHGFTSLVLEVGAIFAAGDI